MAATLQKTYDQLLADECALCYADPLRFVYTFFPWQQPGPLEDYAGPDTWQIDFLEKLGQEVRARKFNGVTAVPPIRFATSSGHGIGKAQPVSLELDTPNGVRRWGDLRVGDRVFGADGRPTEIIAIHEQGERPIYRVTFDDRSATRASAEHLWAVRGRAHRRSGRHGWTEMTTGQLLAAGVTRPNGASRARQWEIPQQAPVEFSGDDNLPIPPYLLGAWLGDGGRVSGLLTAFDAEVIARIQALGESAHETADRGAWRIDGLNTRLRALGLLDRYSYQKSVPSRYRHLSSADRAELLRGLLDTDGECAKHGSVVFNSTSRALAEDVVWLARSLGGKARLQPTVKRPMFTDAQGQSKRGRECWRATLTMPSGFQCFYISRKQERLGAVQARYLARWIAAIEPDGEEDCRCITVAAPDGLYQTNDFIVTHNSVMSAWLVLWIMSTRPFAHGTVTANTITQLETKTWAALQHWNKLCRTGRWFTINTKRMYRNGYHESWFCAPQSSKEENAEAFAGQHAATSTSFYIFDEASAISRKIYETADGGLTDGEPMIFLWGNPTRSDGAFHEAAFGLMRHRWNPIIIDSRTSKFTNKEEIGNWIADRGEDSDFVRVRVRGLPPRAGDIQFIGSDLVHDAQKSDRVPVFFDDDPLVAGFDVARGGDDNCVVWFRRGFDARSIKPIVIPGEQARDSMHVSTVVADVLGRTFNGRKVAMLFVDGTGIGGPLSDRLKQLGHKNVQEIQFGGSSPNPKLANMRSFMWWQMRDWLSKGALPESSRLEIDLTSPGYKHDKHDKLHLESKEDMKKRHLDSPDYGDALALTFAAPVIAKPKPSDRIEVTYDIGQQGTGWLGA